MGVNSEMDTEDARRPVEEAEIGTIVMDGSQVADLRRLMHELANVLTGVMISGGLLEQYLHPNQPATRAPAVHQAHALWQYAGGVCEGCERGCALLRELRSQLLAACGESEAGVLGSSSEGGKPDVESL